MTKFSENELLNREHSFHTGIVVIAHLLLAGVAMIFLGYALNRYVDDGGWSVGSLLRIAIAFAVFGYYYHSVHAYTGIFYALDLWEQSLLRRRSDDELIRAFNNGQKIFKDFREVEVFDGRIVLKPDGMRLGLPEAPIDDTKRTDA
jgi:hypothetical protein